MEALQTLIGGFGFILILVLTVVNLIIYHKYFRVVYFDLGKGIVKEITAAMCLAMAEVAVGSMIIYGIWNAAKGILGFLLKAIVIIVGIVLVLSIVAGIVSAVKNRGNKTNNMSSDVNEKDEEFSEGCTKQGV